MAFNYFDYFCAIIKFKRVEKLILNLQNYAKVDCLDPINYWNLGFNFPLGSWFRRIKYSSME